ncbi:hypothetical protein [Bradyrhizobium elkanii]|uniref:hypothetical protein n=1 Tax=Bradyrhizobium elkanii TaxID=29448 RepID=UPI0004229CFB|nr:hypothetical protein [Bradyrhizobium elkanii]
MTLTICTARYEREHGQKPQGRGYWRFLLISAAVTVADHFVNCNTETDYHQALKRATDVAALRRHVHSIVVLP